VQARHAKIVNSSEASAASSVITLTDEAAPTEYQFKVSVPAGSTLVEQADGSVVLDAADGRPLGSFLAPWAKDATGKALPTGYTVSRDRGRYVLTQHVDTAGAVFPVTADPKWTTGWVTGTLYFNKSETINIASGSATLIGGVCAASGALGGPPLIGACLIGAGQAIYTANAAKNAGKCLKLKMLIAGPPVYLGGYTYSGGYCT
jgi:hypothetical protein